MQEIEITKAKFRRLVQDELDIANPVLLKSGVLGVLTEYLSNIQYDVTNYYSDVFREMNPGLARDFNSMLFHSSLYDTELKFANPATFDISIVINPIAIKNVKTMEYSIPKNTKFQDDNGYDFIIPERIEIVQSETNLSAFSYNDAARKQLLVTVAPDPTSPGKNIYLVHYSGVLQLKRSYKKIIVPTYNPGETFKFNISVSNYKNIKSITSWINTKDNTSLKMDVIETFSPENVESFFKIPKMNNKFFKFKSNRLSLDLFLTIYDSNIQFETGDGRLGKHLDNNDELIVCIEETLGTSGNINNLSFQLTDIQTKITSHNDLEDLTKYNLTGISIDGGSDGKNIQTIDSMKQELFNKISYRQSLTSINDFERYFENNNIRPYVDTKFINGENFVYIYNVMETKIQNNSVVLDTISANIKESDIAQNPFYPTIVHNGVELVSPFYYKFLSTNETELYIVNPKIYIELFPNALNNISDALVFSLNYDFERNKSFFKIDQGAIADKSYLFETDEFTFTLDYSNNFTYEVNTLFTDEFCIIKKPITYVKLNVQNKNNEITSKFSTNFQDNELYQLILKQNAFKYYKPKDVTVIPEVVDLSDISLGYLDNELRGILADADKILHPYANDETPYLLKLPYIEKSFLDLDFMTSYNLLNDFFKIQVIKKYINFNTRVYQCFYNTLDLEEKYMTSVYRKNNNVDPSINKKISIKVFIDKNFFNISKTFSSFSDLELSLKIDIINFFKTKRGFEIRYFESELENIIYQKYNVNSDYPYIKNIEILEPSVFIINDSDTIFYNIKNKLTFDDLIDFCPPFFQFDIQNITLDITY